MNHSRFLVRAEVYFKQIESRSGDQLQGSFCTAASGHGKRLFRGALKRTLKIELNEWIAGIPRRQFETRRQRSPGAAVFFTYDQVNGKRLYAVEARTHGRIGPCARVARRWS